MRASQGRHEKTRSSFSGSPAGTDSSRTVVLLEPDQSGRGVLYPGDVLFCGPDSLDALRLWDIVVCQIMVNGETEAVPRRIVGRKKSVVGEQFLLRVDTHVITSWLTQRVREKSGDEWSTFTEPGAASTRDRRGSA